MGLNQSNPKDEDRTIKEFDKVKDVVIRFLRDLPATRNSDKLLYYEISTIVRVRRQIQNKDRVFEPTDPDVRRKRKIRSEDIGDWAGDN